MELNIRKRTYKIFKNGKYTGREAGVLYNAADPLARARKVYHLKMDYPTEEGYALLFVDDTKFIR